MAVLLTSIHKNFAIIQTKCLGLSIKQCYDMLIDENALLKYDIPPILKLSKPYFYKFCTRFTADDIEKARKIWDREILHEHLALKRSRVCALQDMFNKETSTEAKRRILKDIREEVGEESWQKAVKESGGSPVVNNIVAGLTPTLMKAFAREIINEETEIEDDNEECDCPDGDCTCNNAEEPANEEKS